MDPHDLNRVLNPPAGSLTKKVEVMKIGPNLTLEPVPTAIPIKSNIIPTSSPVTMTPATSSLLHRLPGNISVSQKPVPIDASQQQPQLIQLAGPSGSNTNTTTTTAATKSYVQMSSGSGGPADRRVVVERIGDTFKVVQPSVVAVKDTVIVNSAPNVQQIVVPRSALTKNIKIVNTGPGPQQNRILISGRNPYRPIAPKPLVQQVVVSKAAAPIQLPVQQVVKKIAPKPDPTKLEKIVIVRKTPGGVTEIVKLPSSPTERVPLPKPPHVLRGPFTVNQKERQAPVYIKEKSIPSVQIKEPKPIPVQLKEPQKLSKPCAPAVQPQPPEPKAQPNAQDKLDQLMRDLIEAESEAEPQKPNKNDFHSKELQLIKNLKRTPNLPQKRDVPIAPKPAPPARAYSPKPTTSTLLRVTPSVSAAPSQLKQNTILVSKNSARNIGGAQIVQINAQDPKFAALFKSATDRLATLPVKYTVTEKVQEILKKPPPETTIQKVPPPETPKPGTSSLTGETIEIQISDGKLSDPNGPIKIMAAQEKSPRTQARSQSLIDTQTKDSIKRNFRSLSMPESDEIPPSPELPSIPKTPPRQEKEIVVPTKIDENLLCDENIDQVSPDKVDPNPPVPVQRAPRINKRKTAHKTLSEPAPIKTIKSEEETEDEEVDIMAYENKLSKRRRSPEAKKPEVVSGDESDEGVVADVLEVPIGKLFEYGVEPDDIYLSDPFRYIKWKDGIGSLRNGSIHFKINEYGVYEVMANSEYYACKRSRGDRSHQYSLAQRGDRKRRHPTAQRYVCNICGESGGAEEFVEPDFCSWQCKEASVEVKRHRLDTVEIKTEEPDSSPEDDEEMQEDEEEEEESWIKETDAPLSLFRNAIPNGRNNFQVGMKLEAIDPFNPALFCVCTVVDKRGYRIKLRFDGFSTEYDFWTNADSKSIFPPGWCAATGRKIEPPAQWAPEKKFNWNEYLKEPKVMAPVQLFQHLQDENAPKWYVGRKLEADLPEGEGDGVTAATVRDIIGRRVLIHLDFYKTNFWVNTDSPLIHPINWHDEMKQTFNSPQRDFDWPTYLRTERTKAIHEDVFDPRPPRAFRPGMKIEVVDPKNAALIRPATVAHIEGYRIRILFDGWPAAYAFWTNDDSPDLHPVGWAKQTRHPLEPVVVADKPNEVCGIFRGCLGYGNARNKTRPFHRVADECPYNPCNWSQPDVSDRLVPVPKSKRGTWKRHVEAPVNPEGVQSDSEVEKLIGRKKLADTEATTQRDELWDLNSTKMPLPEVDVTKVSDWSPRQVQEFVAKIPGCALHAATFEREQIDGSAFVTLNKDDLEYLGLKFGPTLKIYNRVLKLRELVLKDVSR